MSGIAGGRTNNHHRKTPPMYHHETAIKALQAHDKRKLHLEHCRFCKEWGTMITDNEGDKYCQNEACEMYQ